MVYIFTALKVKRSRFVDLRNTIFHGCITLVSLRLCLPKIFSSKIRKLCLPLRLNFTPRYPPN